MFVVAPISRTHVPGVDGKPDTFIKDYPVVFEDLDGGFAHPPIAHRDSRREAEVLAAELNAVLSAEID